MGDIDYNEVVVSISCIVYNQYNYIKKCLDGFLMQQTNFAFEILIHDDASTDGTAEIIKEYEAQYPNIIKPIYETENQWLQGRRGSVEFNFHRARGNYIAMCEGDDYWLDPLKLQKQVDFLESHPEYTMVCSDAIIQTSKGELDWCRYAKDQEVPIDDIIRNGGLFIQTASYLFRRKILAKYPVCCQRCHVGDYPLIIYAALNGKVRWFAEKQVVYRFAIGNSWTATSSLCDISKQMVGWRSEVDMLIGLDKYSEYKYHNVFNERQALYIYEILRNNQKYLCDIEKHFYDIREKYSFQQKINIFLMRNKLYYPIVNIIKRCRSKNEKI